MTAFEWAMVVLTAIGVLLTSGGMLVAVTRGVEKIRQDTTKRIADEVLARENAMAALRNELGINSDKQYQEFGETASALRRFIESLERDMRQAELWGRDNYVQKPDFQRSVDGLSKTMSEGFAGLKGDISSLRKEINNSRTRSGETD